MQDETRSGPTIETLLARGEERGCVSESEIDRLVEALELDDEGVEDVREALPARRRGAGRLRQPTCRRPATPTRPRGAHDRLDGPVPAARPGASRC